MFDDNGLKTNENIDPVDADTAEPELDINGDPISEEPLSKPKSKFISKLKSGAKDRFIDRPKTKISNKYNNARKRARDLPKEKAALISAKMDGNLAGRAVKAGATKVGTGLKAVGHDILHHNNNGIKDKHDLKKENKKMFMQDPKSESQPNAMKKFNPSIGRGARALRKNAVFTGKAIVRGTGRGIKNGTKAAGKGIWNGIKNNAKKRKEKITNSKAYKKAAKMARFVYMHGFVFGIGTAIIVLGYSLTIFLIGVAQAVGHTPHYYCDIDAAKPVKESNVYKQYCKRQSLSWSVKNINGHYIVQDGTDKQNKIEENCAILNMLLRFYTIDTEDFWFGGINVYNYLWQKDGQYTMYGNSVAATADNSNNTIRQVFNNNNKEINGNFSKNTGNTPNGTLQFANEHDIANFDGANWGYLRDDTIDYKKWEVTSDFYDPQKNNAKWVWDLSIKPNEQGFRWDMIDWNDIKIRFGVTQAKINKQIIANHDAEYYKKQYKEQIMFLLSGKSDAGVDDDKIISEYYKGSAGIVVKYTQKSALDGKEKDHTVLITRYDNDPNSNEYVFFGVDSKKGITGGFEGPLDGTGRFVIDDIGVNDMLKSDTGIGYGKVYYGSNGQQLRDTFTLTQYGYCTHNKFGWF